MVRMTLEDVKPDRHVPAAFPHQVSFYKREQGLAQQEPRDECFGYINDEAE